MLSAFQTLWSRPFFVRHPGKEFQVEDFELLTTILSAMEWRKHNGSIRMIGDKAACGYYESLGLDILWDDGLHPILDDRIPADLSPDCFWAAGKLYALREMPAPCVMIDTDFIVWQDLMPDIQENAIAVIHREAVHNDIYPDISPLKTQCRFFPEVTNWDAEACNTALSYFRDQDFKDYYARHAIGFMEHSPQADDPLIYMVFAEQRMLALCADACGIPIHALSTLPELFSSKQTKFTHTWGFKQQMRDNPALQRAFCQRCLVRIQTEFPQLMPMIEKIPVFTPYLKK